MKATAIALAALSLLLTGCPKPQTATSTTGTTAPATGVSGLPLASEVDHLAEALAGESIDQRNIALLIVTKFGLTEYRENVLALTAIDPVAAAALAAVHDEIQPALDYFTAQSHGVRIDSLLGSVYGLACTADIPAELWVAVLDEADENEQLALLWAMAQLDIEPGGPVARSDDLNAALNVIFNEALLADNISIMGAADALLGHAEGRAIGWQRYIDSVSQSPWNFMQWAALLRFADAATWQSIVITRGLDDRIRYQIGRAVTLQAPPEVRLPGGIGPWAGIEAGIEYRANQFVTGKTETMPLAELAVLVEDAQVQLTARDDAEPITLNQRVLGDVLAVLDYALIHGDSTAVAAVVDAMSELPGEARSGAMATIMRRRPAALSDGQLDQLAELRDPNVAYFLLSGWYDRQVIRDGPTASLARLAIGYDNVLLIEGYELWLSHLDGDGVTTEAADTQIPSM